MSNGSSGVTVGDTRRVFDELDEPGAPLATGEIAAELDCEERAARRNLEALADEGALKRREFGDDRCVWWQPTDCQRERDRTITEAEQAEEFRALVEAVDNYAIFLLDTSGRVQTWNEGAERTKGYTEDEILGEHISAFYPDDGSESDPEELLAEAADEGSVEDEGWRVRQDGERFWAHVTITALYGEDGEFRGFAKITRDLTDRHEREEELRRERDITEQFRRLVDSVEEYAIFMLDPEGRVQTWNEGARRLKGYAEDEIVGEHFSAFYTEDAVEAGVPGGNLDAAREHGHCEDEGWRVRQDGERFWADVTITPVRGGDGELRGFAKVVRDMTERHRREQRLREEKERFQRLVEEVKDYAIFMLDPGGVVQTWNEGAERLKGYTEDEIVGEHFSAFYPGDSDTSPEQLLAEAAARGRVSAEGWRVRKDGSRFWAHVTITALHDEDDELRGFAKVTRDLTQRKRREDRLAALDEMGRALLEAESPAAVCDIVVDAAETDLDLPITTVARYDDESGTLRPTSRTERAAQYQDAVPFLDPATEVSWEVFGDSEPLVVEGLGEEADAADLPVTSGVVVPVGRHGVFITAFTAPDGPDDEEVDFAKVVASDLEAALNHAERQQLLADREAALEEQNESLTRLNRINGVIRRIDQALVDATSRAEVEQALCNELASAGPYRFAWVGHHDSASGTVTPETWAGIETNYADGLSVETAGSPTGEHPTATATRLREPYAVPDIQSDPPFEPWRKEALKRGHRSLISVPLLYEDSLYGVLTIHADQSDTFTGMERQVIEELGETAAHAINALESKRALVSDDVVELELRMRDPEIPFLRLVSETDCAFELESVLSRQDGSLGVFFTTRGTPASAVEAFAEQSFALADLRVVSEGEECVFEATATDDSLVATLLDQGAVPQTLTAEDGVGRVVVTLSTGSDVREFVEMLQAKYPESELTARRTRDRAARTPHEFKAAFEDRLTDRQREVLQTAYFGGFFDSPRQSTGQEIGDALGVSQPTVNHHLRTCQRELLGMLYEEEPAGLLDR